MSCIVDILCEDCNNLFEFDKGSMIADTPVDIECPRCKSINTHRKYGLAGHDIGEGLLGNAKNGYSKGFTYHPNSIVGRTKGVKVK